MDLIQAEQPDDPDDAAFRILQTKARNDVVQHRELNAYVANQLRYENVPLINAPIEQMMNNLQPEIETLTDLAKWCVIEQGELQNHIDWSFNGFADFTDYVPLRTVFQSA